MRGGKGDSLAAVVVVPSGQAHCQAKVGQVRDPEVFQPEVKPGSIYGELVYVFRPKSRGTYQVKVTPVYDREEEAEARVCTVEVAD
jgi:hypothetical protein